MTEKDKGHPTSFRPYPSLKEELRRLADEDRRTLSKYIEIVLEDHVKAVKAKRRGRANASA